MTDPLIFRTLGFRLSSYLLAVAFIAFGVPGVASWAQSPQTSGPVSLQGAGSTFAAKFSRGKSATL
jgi:hypothetical protein